MVLTKINEGEISRSTADKIRDLQVQKYSDMVIAKKLGLRTNFIPILDYFSEIDNTTVEKEDTNVSSPSPILFNFLSRKWIAYVNNDKVGEFDSKEEAILARKNFIKSDDQDVNVESKSYLNYLNMFM